MRFDLVSRSLEGRTLGPTVRPNRGTRCWTERDCVMIEEHAYVDVPGRVQ